MRSSDRANRDWFKIKNADTNSKEDGPTEIYIFDEIGYWGTSAQEFIRQMMEINSDSIDLHLNSPGGEVWDGVAIYNALKMHKADVTVFVDGLAASAASFISQAGDKVIMGQAATMMIHDGLAICIGNSVDMRETANILDKISDNIAGIYASRAGGTSESWREFMRAETWYNAQEAVDAGLADEISGQINEVENKWDLTIFNHAGRENAPSPSQVRTAILNRANKEAPVSKAVKNSEETPKAPGVEEEVPPITTDESVEESPVEESVQVEEEVVVEPVLATNTTTSGFTFRLGDGTETVDPRVVQNRLSALEQFQKDTMENNRKDFVKSLASDNKILASHMTKVENFALALSPEMYEQWRTSWDAVPVSSVLQEPPVMPSQGGQQNKDEEIDILTQTVMAHKRGGMKEAQIKNTESYKKLMILSPEFKL